MCRLADKKGAVSPFFYFSVLVGDLDNRRNQFGGE